MKLLGPTRNERLNEAAGVVYLIGALVLALSLYSFHPNDPSFNTATATEHANKLIGRAGSYTSDILYQIFGFGAWLVPAGVLGLGWKWVRSKPIQVPFVKAFGFSILILGSCTSFALIPGLRPFDGVLPAGGLAGVLMADLLVGALNTTGAALLTATSMFVSLYLVSSFSLAKLPLWFAHPIGWSRRQHERWTRWRKERVALKMARLKRKEEQLMEKASRRKREAAPGPEVTMRSIPAREEPTRDPAYDRDLPPWEEPRDPRFEDRDPERRHEPETEPEPEVEPEIPICVLEEPEPPEMAPPPPPVREPEPFRSSMDTSRPPAAARRKVTYQIPSSALLNEVPVRAGYDGFELKEIAGRIKAKLEEFNVFGSVVQINPGPVVTTFEYKPDAGVKYSKIVTLNDDLCLGLQAESIFIERLAGKPTVGIEVPNSRREVISLRQILESEEFNDSASKMTICLGKDINGRIKVTPLETMPHLLIAGSTGSGKSVMLNSLIMSVLFKATPDDVRMVLIDPKRVEMGIYEGIPHLLTPVITDAKQATNALRNAVLEMERRLKLLASQGVRNIDQFNKKVRQMANEPRSLFEEDDAAGQEQLEPLPYILVVIDELADLMMLERANVEAAVTRLAQMARAVGMHLVLATQRPSVDVITGLIKANFPSRISFRVATRVDSRTVLDVMGAEHLLGKGDMLFLPPGSSRLTRVHGALVTENEINRVVEFWRDQAIPDYDQSFLMPPPSDEDDVEVGGEGGGEPGTQDPMYQDAVRVVLEMGKASTSILQRRLRLGYGRAARILDMMFKDGIIGPPDGSRPREVLKRPEWLDETEEGRR
ncbi:MAG: DNA translocase FtsK [Bryobacterales bacterium]|nr:DNA translocase FtsK [Bryobacterales bacterium]